MKKVLIVEDDQGWQEILKRWIEGFGYEVVGVAANQRTALGIFHEKQPDLITMDGELENQESGIDVAAAIRSQNTTVPIVIVSGRRLTFEGRGVSKATIEIEEFEKYLSQLLQ